MNCQPIKRARPSAPRRATRRKARRGSAILEFSLISPILLSLLLLCIDFGRVPFYYIAVTNAARAGAGYASANPAPAGSWTNAFGGASGLADQRTERHQS